MDLNELIHLFEELRLKGHAVPNESTSINIDEDVSICSQDSIVEFRTEVLEQIGYGSCNESEDVDIYPPLSKLQALAALETVCCYLTFIPETSDEDCKT